MPVLPARRDSPERHEDRWCRRTARQIGHSACAGVFVAAPAYRVPSIVEVFTLSASARGWPRDRGDQRGCSFGVLYGAPVMSMAHCRMRFSCRLGHLAGHGDIRAGQRMGQVDESPAIGVSGLATLRLGLVSHVSSSWSHHAFLDESARSASATPGSFRAAVDRAERPGRWSVLVAALLPLLPRRQSCRDLRSPSRMATERPSSTGAGGRGPREGSRTAPGRFSSGLPDLVRPAHDGQARIDSPICAAGHSAWPAQHSRVGGAPRDRGVDRGSHRKRWGCTVSVVEQSGSALKAGCRRSATAGTCAPSGSGASPGRRRPDPGCFRSTHMRKLRQERGALSGSGGQGVHLGATMNTVSAYWDDLAPSLMDWRFMYWWTIPSPEPGPTAWMSRWRVTNAVALAMDRSLPSPLRPTRPMK